MTAITGAGGGGGKGGGGGSSRTPSTTPDSLDSRQYANVIDLISEGEIEGLADGLKSIYLNNTPLQNENGTYNFEDVEIYTRTGTQDQDYIPFTPGPEDIKTVGVTVVKDVPVTRSITDVDVDAVRVTISIPSLQRIDSGSGDTLGTSVALEIAIQYASAGFTTVVSDTITGRTADEYRKDYLIELERPNPSDTVDVRVTRITGDSTDSLLANAFAWSSYTEIIWAKLAYPNSALVGLRIDAEQFSSIPSRSYLVKGVKVQIPSGVTVDSDTGRIIYPTNFVWDGTFQQGVAWTSCPAWILYDLLTSSRFGLGDHINTAQLDKWAFFAASKYANTLVDDGFGGTEARFSCNTTIQTAEEAYKLINDLLSVMRCQGFWSSGSLTIAQDRPEDPAFLFTNANVTPEGFSYTGGSLKTRPNVAVVSYLDLTLRDTAFEVVEDVEAIDKYGVVRTEISAFACTSRGQANRIGRWLIYAERYEKEIVSFASSLEAGQQVRPGQIILIADPVKAGSRRAGRINAATATTVTVDDTANTNLSFAGGSILSVLLPDGTVEQREVSTVADGVITVQSAYSAVPAANSIWMLESPTLQASTWRVLSVSEQDGINYAITALAHNEGKYAYIENGEQLQLRDISDLNVIPDPPTDLEVLTVNTFGGVETKELQYVLNGRIAIKVTFHWRGPQGIKKFRVRYRHEDDNFTTVRVQGTTFDIEDAKVGNYQIQVSSISATEILYSEPALANYTVQGLGAPPADITGLSVAPISDTQAILTWQQVPDLDVQLGGRIIVRHDPRPLVSSEWNSSNRIVDGVSGTSTQKQVPLLAGTYFVKAEDYLGNRSENAVGVEVTLPEADARLNVKTWEEHNLGTPFNGSKVNCAYSVSETALLLEPDLYVSLKYVDNLYFEVDGAAEYTFQDTFDLAATYDTILRRRILSRPSSGTGILFDDYPGLFDEAEGLFDQITSDSVNVVTYVRTTEDDPAGTPTWGPWTEFVAAVVRGRGIQIKSEMTTTSAAVNVAVDELGATLDLTRRTETGSGTSGSAVTFANAFYQTPEIIITPTDLGTNGYVTLSSTSATGFTATLTSATSSGFTYTATGFGRAL
jgi:predicted phage tail protein